ncbi:UNVERIFIED_CONTAM: hypothetical protein GTU68_064317 [Idotea baltica]|nr:hypothetical protein [Idotea baltica]
MVKKNRLLCSTYLIRSKKYLH